MLEKFYLDPFEMKWNLILECEFPIESLLLYSTAPRIEVEDADKMASVTSSKIDKNTFVGCTRVMGNRNRVNLKV